MKTQIIPIRPFVLFALLLLALSPFHSFSQYRSIARGAEPGELYIAGNWYGIYNPIYGGYDTLQRAVFRFTENGKKLTIQYDANYFTEDLYEMWPGVILTDATPGAIYNNQVYSNGGYPYSQLYVSFDYGKNWIFREENIGQKFYHSANVDGIIYRGGTDGTFESKDYGNIFYHIEGGAGMETGLQYGEGFRLWCSNPYQGRIFHSYDFFFTFTEFPVDSQYVYVSPDVYRGALPGEVYITSRFPDWTFHVSFSADTGYTFRKVFISESYNPWDYAPTFMSDREPGVFYIVRTEIVEDPNPWGEHKKICIYYFRDYGETLVDIYCHDITKNYGKTCEAVNDLVSEKCSPNCVLLTWSEPESSLPVERYDVYRNQLRITNYELRENTYLDEDLPVGEYEYYVVTHYTTGCVSDTSNHVKETIETCEPVNDLTAEKINDNSILLIWSEPKEEVVIDGYSIYRNNFKITETLIINNSFLDENLLNGNYEYYVIAYYSNGCISDTSNHVTESVELGVKEVNDLEGVRAYPNPTTGELTIETDMRYEIMRCEICDMYGRSVSCDQISNLKTKNLISINISHLHTGIYFVKISTEQGVVMRKIVKR
jgi:hypothetical protein